MIPVCQQPGLTWQMSLRALTPGCVLGHRVPNMTAQACEPRSAVCAHPRAEQARAAGRLDALQRALEGKEAEMARLAGGEGRVTALRAHFDAALAQLAGERNALQRERAQLVQARPCLRAQSVQRPGWLAEERAASAGSWCRRAGCPVSPLAPQLDGHAPVWHSLVGHMWRQRRCRTMPSQSGDGRGSAPAARVMHADTLTECCTGVVQRIASLLEASEEDRLRLQHHYRERLAATDAKMKEVPPPNLSPFCVLRLVQRGLITHVKSAAHGLGRPVWGAWTKYCLAHGSLLHNCTTAPWRMLARLKSGLLVNAGPCSVMQQRASSHALSLESGPNDLAPRAQVRAKERRAAQLEALQRRSQEKCSHLQSDIQAIKQQKARAWPRHHSAQPSPSYDKM